MTLVPLGEVVRLLDVRPAAVYGLVARGRIRRQPTGWGTCYGYALEDVQAWKARQEAARQKGHKRSGPARGTPRGSGALTA
jgi:hypothetical protein